MTIKRRPYKILDKSHTLEQISWFSHLEILVIWQIERIQKFDKSYFNSYENMLEIKVIDSRVIFFLGFCSILKICFLWMFYVSIFHENASPITYTLQF